MLASDLENLTCPHELSPYHSYTSGCLPKTNPSSPRWDVTPSSPEAGRLQDVVVRSPSSQDLPMTEIDFAERDLVLTFHLINAPTAPVDLPFCDGVWWLSSLRTDPRHTSPGLNNSANILENSCFPTTTQNEQTRKPSRCGPDRNHLSRPHLPCMVP